ncbi:hypothetical protein [Streptomyces sp. BoleA5]|uniref:hypothetical protein n=1 Tax=Streptomyces sp. BoleA5 TaxID=1157637 RepID=UPI003B63DAE7
MESTIVRAHVHAAGARTDPGIEGRPLSLIVTLRQRAGCTHLKQVLKMVRIAKPGPVKPRTKPDSVATEKDYRNRLVREYLRRQGIRHTLPEKADTRATRLRKDSRDGRPRGFDEERHKKRNTIDRAIKRRKQHQARGHPL